ncbi:MAG: alpha/beta hydrolase [Melioribacteraceae bacterium]|nr:alpha/beta hydrolase [Melioribacteraceae bacterium]
MRVKNIITILLFSIYLFACQNNTDEINYLPSKDASYTGANIEFYLPCGDKIAGTFTYPKNSVQKLPAVILITGSSAHDRDNSKPGNPINSYRPFRQIAEKLSSNGIAVLRLDDRGIGKSAGWHIDNMTTPERADDIREGIQFLKKRIEVDSLRIGLIGLSEGASIAHMIASKNKSIKGLVLLSGIGSTGKEIIEYQIKNGLYDSNDLPKLLKKNKNLEFLYQFDPLKTAGLIQAPVLIINGKTDRRVPYTDAFKLTNAIRANGNNNVELKILPNYNHLLLKESFDGIETGYGRIQSNRIPDEVLKIILDWIINEI